MWCVELLKWITFSKFYRKMCWTWEGGTSNIWCYFPSDAFHLYNVASKNYKLIVQFSEPPLVKISTKLSNNQLLHVNTDIIYDIYKYTSS
jgi:hypothetical protein